MIKFILLTVPCLFILSCSNQDSTSTENIDTIEQDSATVDLTTEEHAVTTLNVEFPSVDGLVISGALYVVADDAPSILLCHQAGYNMREYDEIAPKLNEMGYNCLAIDQRAGGILADYVNQTADRAIDAELPVQYINAEQDIIAAIDYLVEKYKQDIILWGSSYSSALALHIGTKHEHVKAVVSFSPGDYFGEDKPLLKEAMQSFDLPFFITSSKSEAADITTFLGDKVLNGSHVQFIPEGQGKHGSKALWEEHDGNAEYWEALKSFLGELE